MYVYTMKIQSTNYRAEYFFLNFKETFIRTQTVYTKTVGLRQRAPPNAHQQKGDILIGQNPYSDMNYSLM